MRRGFWMEAGWGRAVLLAAGSGVLQVLAYPIAGPVPLWRTHVGWVALLPLLLAIVGERDRPGASVWRSAGLGYLAGVIFFLGNCYWIFQTMYLYGGLAKPVAAGILVLFALYLGLYEAVFGAALAWMRRVWGRNGALLLVPVLWVAVELLRWKVTGFPWDLLGVTQVDSPMLRRLAPWTGVSGMSFAIAGVNALWLLRLELRERRWTRPALAAGGVAVLAGFGALAVWGGRVTEQGTPGLATLLQENLAVGTEAAGKAPESEATLLRAFVALSERPAPMVLAGMPQVAGTRVVERRRELAVVNGAGSAGGAEGSDGAEGSGGAAGSGGARVVERTDVVLWPESPAPFEEVQPGFRAAVSGMARAVGAPVVVGNIGLDAPAAAGERATLYNSASFVRADGVFAGRYDKVHLVPFGEYVPFKRLFFFAGHLLDEVGTFTPGAERRVFAAGGHRFGVFICYESIFGDEVRQFVRRGADVLVNLSNDGWYGDTSAPWQHLNMVRMRALETHRWVLRATNTGVTAAINPDGRVVAAAPRHVRTAVVVPFFYEEGETFYVRHGDWLAWGCLGAAVLAGVGGAGRRRAVG